MPWIKSCLCHQPERKAAPHISPPLHLLLKADGGPHGNHNFRCKVFKKPRPCHLCHQPIHNQGSCCRVCKYVCHKVCESKHTHRDDQPSRNGLKSAKMMPSSTSAHALGDARSMRQTVAAASSTRSRRHSGMDMVYVTERMMALWFPTEITANAYRQGHRQAADMLKSKHDDNYMVFNLSEPKRVVRSVHRHIKEVGWASSLAPPLETLCSICKQIDSWLSADKRHIAVLHARGSKDRLGVIVSAYMHYSIICGRSEQALDRFAMRRFLEDHIGSLRLPSNKRYVDCFTELLAGNVRFNAAPLYLTHVTVLGAPAFSTEGDAGGCRAFLKIYEGLTPVYTSGVYDVAGNAKQFTVNVAGEQGLSLRGDVLVKCYHRHPKGREHIFACQFHTCAVSDYNLSFTRQDLDYANTDPRFPLDGAVELHFSASADAPRQPLPAPTPAIPVSMPADSDSITRYDSVEDLRDDDEDDEEEVDDEDDDEEADRDESDQDDVRHIYGPLDRSIYATIAKKPELSPGTVSSPLTVSMDSGISSAGHQQNAHPTNGGCGGGGGSSSSPPTAQPSPLSAEHRELDELVTNMLLNVESIADVRPSPAAIPYHAREDSQPFRYVDGDMIAPQKMGLSSPGLVRKASFSGAQPEAFRRLQTQVHRPRDPIDDLFTDSANSAFSRAEDEEDAPLRAMRRSRTDGTLRRASPPGRAFCSDTESLSPTKSYSSHYENNYGSSGSLTWLQQKQMKLKERREMQLREERNPAERHLLAELRLIHQARHGRPTASYRLDGGYTSDTTAFADDDDDDDRHHLTSPLHISTMLAAAKGGGGASAPGSPFLQRRSASVKERPFMAVKRAHEQSVRKYGQDALAANPLGHVVGGRSRSRGGDDSTDSGLLSTVSSKQQRYNGGGHSYRESMSSWRTTSASEAECSPPRSTSPRPQTPAFPVHPRTPYVNSSTPTPTVQFDLPPKSPTTQRRVSYHAHLNTAKKYYREMYNDSKDISLTNGHAEYSVSKTTAAYNGSASPMMFLGGSRRLSITETQDVSPAHVKFVRNTSGYWYRPKITREEAIKLVRDQPAGTFVVRDSNSFPNSFGMAVKVSLPPANIRVSSGGDELVRHFLVEPVPGGVRLKGLANEPVFSSLSALVYQHSLTAMALPCRLLLPEGDAPPLPAPSAAHQLATQGAACSVLFLLSADMESLTGPHAIRRAVHQLFMQKPLPPAAVVHFKVSGEGITLTDSQRHLFFRRFYPMNTVTHCSLDPDDHRWSVQTADSGIPDSSKKIFGFVAKKPVSGTDNQCHLFAELEPNQPASAIVSFVIKMMSNERSNAYIL